MHKKLFKQSGVAHYLSRMRNRVIIIELRIINSFTPSSLQELISHFRFYDYSISHILDCANIYLEITNLC